MHRPFLHVAPSYRSKTTEKTVNKVAYLTFTRYTHFVLTPDLRVQILDNSCLMHEYFQVAKDCWHCWKNPNLANELSEPRIYTKYLSPETEKRTNFGDFERSVWKLTKKVSFWKKFYNFYWAHAFLSARILERTLSNKKWDHLVIFKHCDVSGSNKKSWFERSVETENWKSITSALLRYYYFSHSHLIVKKEIDGSYENTLKRVEEMRCDGPNCKTQPRST